MAGTFSKQVISSGHNNYRFRDQLIDIKSQDFGLESVPFNSQLLEEIFKLFAGAGSVNHIMVILKPAAELDPILQC